MTMDKKGRLFVGHASLGHVFVFAPNGEMIARIKSCAGGACTNVAIGGEKRDRLYITESTTGTVLVADIGVLDSVIARAGEVDTRARYDGTTGCDNNHSATADQRRR